MHRAIRTFVIAGGLVVAGAAPAAAQQGATDRGSIQLSGSASITSSADEGDNDRTTDITLNPRVGYFVMPKLALGASVSLSRQSRGDNSLRAYGIGPFASYYFGAVGATMQPYVTGGLSWQKTKVDTSVGDGERTGTGFNAGAGVLFLLSPSVGITTELFYRRAKMEFGSFERSADAYGLAVGVAAFVF